jgi:hypothetical protein
MRSRGVLGSILALAASVTLLSCSSSDPVPAAIAAARTATPSLPSTPSASPSSTAPATHPPYPRTASAPSGSPSLAFTPPPSFQNSATPAPTAGASAPSGRQLPRGGTDLFPRYRLVGYSGAPGSAAFGRLGIGNLDGRVREMERIARAYTRDGRQPLPILELITVVVQAHPGRDGLYRSQIDDTQIARYLAAARRHKALLLLNIQPGRADFLTEVKGLQRWLAEPDVGIALDPEWAVGRNQVPGRVFGRTTAKELNSVAAYLSAFTVAQHLPDKALVVHQLAPRIISRIQDVKRHPGIEMVLSVDGIGARPDKVATWLRLMKPRPASIRPGFKLFFEEDRDHGKLMTPTQVMALTPTPDYVLYE